MLQTRVRAGRSCVVAAIVGAAALFAGNPRPASAGEARALLDETGAASSLPLVTSSSAADLYVDPADFRVTSIAAEALASDIEQVTGKRPAVKKDAAGLGASAVIIGTIGKSAAIDRLIDQKKIDVSQLRGQWESFLLQVVNNPLPGVDRALVIAGSDRRGTAFGVFELSEQIGVSPWVYWADSAPKHRKTLSIKAAVQVVGPPRVKYRGFFINDEDWGLTPWAAKHLDKDINNIGPKTYAKVFELMLRLKANYLWPAMHPVSEEFGKIKENITLADDYAIVMGASHAEPMNRDNVHWNQENRGPWRYDTNKAGVDAYWEEWAKLRGKYEAVWSVGMRGIHDSGMQGPRDINEQVAILQNAIQSQRKLITQYVGPAAEVPQAFMPYKEALAQYQAGLKLPDDVTLVWCDDNYGYIRQLNTPAEQKRTGGAGVYYHISYLGAPKPYLWINTTPPALIWSEMHKALAYGADRIWVLNVGDIKPGEIGMEFWTKFAWNPAAYGPGAQHQFLVEFATREFGADNAEAIATLLDDYYRLAFARKPELMARDVFSVVHYAEARTRLAAYTDLMQRGSALAQQVPPGQRNAFLEMVLYPLRVAAHTNDAFIGAALADFETARQMPTANAFAAQANSAVKQVTNETIDFNKSLMGGKWDGIVQLTGWSRTGEYAGWADWWFLDWPKPQGFRPGGASHLGVLIDGRSRTLMDGKPVQPAAAGNTVVLPLGTVALKSPWQRKRDAGVSYLVAADGSGNAMDAERATGLPMAVAVPVAGEYRLILRVRCASDDDDSWHLRVDERPWLTLNNVGATRGWKWVQAGPPVRLEAGEHRITLANREDGAQVAQMRLTDAPGLPADDETSDPAADAAPDRMPEFVQGLGQTHGLTLFDPANELTEYRVKTSGPWVRLRQHGAEIDAEAAAKGDGVAIKGGRVEVSIDFTKLPVDGVKQSDAPADAPADTRAEAPANTVTGHITFTAGGKTSAVGLIVRRAPAGAGKGMFVESDGVISIEAEHFNASKEGSGEEPGRAGTRPTWQVVHGLGRTGAGAVTILPEQAASLTTAEQIRKNAPSLEYTVFVTTAGEVTLHAYCLPTHRINEQRGLRYAVSFDDQPPTIVDFGESGGRSGEGTGEWLTRVARNTAVSQTPHALPAPGKHTLRLWMVDPGVVVDKLVLDTGGLRQSELGPPETRVVE